MMADVPEQRGVKLNYTRRLFVLLLLYGLLWSWLAIDPVDRRDWVLENLLALTLIFILVSTYRRFKFSTTSYVLIVLFLGLHAIGAHYTYAEVPSGFWLKDLLALSRNPFDRIAHFAYGALMVYPVRELLLRLSGVRGQWSFYLPVAMILALSGLFEIIEAVVAVIVSPELGSLYLGTQGDEWDAQKDMAAAFGGSILGSIFIRTTSRSQEPDPAGAKD
ncbi:DUF2238 domain-containing protein [Petrachloros mirabilis]